MDRRSFLKQAAATAAVGAVAPKLLAAQSATAGVDTGMAAGASRVVIGSAQYTITLDTVNWQWVMVPVLKARALTGKYDELTSAHRRMCGAFETDDNLPWHPMYVEEGGDLAVDTETESAVT
jgi:hypothetical protein